MADTIYGPSALVNQVWLNSQTLASTYKASTDAALEEAVTAAGSSAPSITPESFGFTPTVVEPNVTIPTDAEKAGFEAFREIWEETIADLSTRYTDFINTYFPDETPYINEAQAWMYNAIKNGGTGLAQSVEESIWQRDRARLVKEAARAEDTQIISWAARGYPLPPGALAHGIKVVQQETRDKIAEASTKVAIAQAELEQKNVQFAVENAIKLWTGAMNAAGEYIKAIATGPGAAGQIIPSVTDSQSKLISAANQYYTSRIAVEELRMKAALPTSQWSQEAREKNAALTMDWIKAKVAAAIEAAKLAGTITASSLNSLHASASTSMGVSNSVGWSYSNDTSAAGETRGFTNF